MKRILSILLVLAMLVCLIPAFTVTAASTEGTECTIVEHKNDTETFFGNRTGGWTWTQTTSATDPTPDWKTSLPADWNTTVQGEVFDSNGRNTMTEGETNVWEAETYTDLWVVRKVSVSAARYEEIKDKAMSSYMRHCDNVEVYINGTLVMDDPRGEGWTDDLTTFSIAQTVGDVFLQDTDGSYYGYVAAHVHRNNAPYWFDMNLEVIVSTVDEVYTEVYIANADQYLDYIAKENNAAYNLNGNVPVQVTVTGNLDFTGKNYAPIESLSNTMMDFGGYTVSGIYYENNDVGNQCGLIAVEATNNTIIENIVMKNCSIIVSKDWADTFVGAIIGWANDAAVYDAVIENVTIVNNCDNENGFHHGGIGGVVGVSNNGIVVESVTMKNMILSAPLSNASFVIARHGSEQGVHTFFDITVEDAVVDAQFVGEDDLSLLCYKAFDASVELGDNISFDYTTGSVLTAPKAGYSAYLQTRDGAKAGTYDFRIIVAASKELTDTIQGIEPTINFDVTFKNGIEGQEESATLSAGTIYSSVTATDAVGTVETYYAAGNSYIFGWVIKGVPASYASTEGELAPTVTLNLSTEAE